MQTLDHHQLRLKKEIRKLRKELSLSTVHQHHLSNVCIDVMFH